MIRAWLIRALLVCLVLAPGLALAQGLPALFNVTGVDENDMLNVRNGPGIDHDILGKLPPDATGIEVVDTDETGEWGLINIDEGAGWVAMRYLARGPGQPEDGLAQSLRCFGTEPFWDFRLNPDQTALFARPETETRFSGVIRVPSLNRRDRHALFGDGKSVVFTAIVGRDICTDGMSDRVYGLSLDLIVTDKAGVDVYSGCCSVAP